ncbi:hypothetical protein MHY1_00298 [Methylovirgula sp. HY1]|nr:hypothetical protein MHY1_00298 [Methylovirgula sp. HY1]
MAAAAIRRSRERRDRECAALTPLFKSLLAVLAGTALGLAATYYILGAGMRFDEVKAGPWTRWSKSGAMDIDPYAHAMLARSGEMPLGSAEGSSFFAWTDNAGAALRGRCDYVLSGSVPSTRYWTLSLYSPTGAIIDNLDKRFGFTSAEILRAADGSFEITISREARPGNWLQVGNVAHFALVLRLYDTLVDFGLSNTAPKALPQIVKGHCA